MSKTSRALRLSFHGRILDHLGIQMYQSPVAAVAELVSNAWDADAEKVEIQLPEQIHDGATLVVHDDGRGMTFADCQDRFLNVGWCRRGSNPQERTAGKERPVLGRKGIGKFAGFGISEIVRVDTVSAINGEKTSFEMDIEVLRSGDYVQEGGEVALLDHLPPDANRTSSHGTTVTLRKLKMARCPSPALFATSMARRFLLHQRADDFRVLVNGKPLPDDDDIAHVEYVFPRDYRNSDRPVGLDLQDGWGVERLANGRQIQWRVLFFPSPIEEEELRGLAVFAHGKLAQKPFLFNLSGGLSGQHGQEYMAGQIEADFVDELSEDVIATERQRISWEHPETIPLEQWGQHRVRQLLSIWRDRRGEHRRRQIEEKIAAFSARLDRLPSHEQRVVRRALNRLGGIPTLSDSQFQSLGEAILQAWEQGRLRELIDDLANREEVTSAWLLSALTEADVLVALNLGEAVRTKLEAIRGLRTLVERGELENRVRDYIAEKPYLLHPQWETFRKEVSVRTLMQEAAKEAGLTDPSDIDQCGQRMRIDLALRSGDHLLIVEFMRPGIRADWDHLSRCRRYILLIRDKLEVETALGIRRTTGLLVADRLDSDASVRQEVKEMQKSDILAFTWESLLAESERTWREFLSILGSRAPSDERLQRLQVERDGRIAG